MPEFTDLSLQDRSRRLWTWLSTLTALTLLTLLIHGYHPLSEDGGLYVAGIEYMLDRTLFPHYTAFVTEHLHFSLFAPLLAVAVHMTHLPLAWVLLLADLFSIALTLVAARELLRRCIASAPAQLAGLALFTAWWTLPVAGTSLLMMDPYVTARSFSTPLSLLAIAFALDDPTRADGQVRWLPTRACLCTLALAALFHPLMAGYAAAFAMTVRLAHLPQARRGLMLAGLFAFGLAGALQSHAPAEGPATLAAAASRYYWFLSDWQWYELLGLVGPLIILNELLRQRHGSLTESALALIRASIFLGILAVLIALVFAHRDTSTHLVARLQPLRIFLLIYAVMTLLLGAALTKVLMRQIARAASKTKRRALLTVPYVTFAVLAVTFFFVQRQTYTVSPQVELPGREVRHPNPWVQAFLWVRANTPRDALFALDARYVNEDGEDAQTFRAWSLRSALPDYSKDGGEAAITTALAPAWQRAADAQQGLSREDDKQRDARIRPLGATWMILHSTAATEHECPYQNATVKVCRLEP